MGILLLFVIIVADILLIKLILVLANALTLDPLLAAAIVLAMICYLLIGGLLAQQHMKMTESKLEKLTILLCSLTLWPIVITFGF